MAFVIDFRLDSPYFFMPHFHMHAAGIQFFYGLFHGSPYIAAHSLPVLFLETLGNGKVLYSFFFTGSLDPEFELGAGCKYNVLNFGEGEIFHSLHFCTGQEFFQFACYIFAGFLQHGTGIDEFSVMNQKCRDAESSYRKAGFFGNIFIIVVHIPVDAAVGHHVDAGIIQCSDVLEYDGRPIRLYCFTCKEILIVFHKDFNRDSFICVIACQINPNQRNETDFRMLCQ